MPKSLAAKIIVSVSSILIVLAVGVSILTFVRVRQDAIMRLELRGAMLADMLQYSFEVLLEQKSVLGQSDMFSLQRLAENSIQVQDMHAVMIVDQSGSILVSGNLSDVGQTTTSPQMQSYLQEAHWRRKTHLNADNMLVILQPISGGTLQSDTGSAIAGVIEIRIDRQSAVAAARSTALSLLGISFGAYFLLGFVLLWLMRTTIVQPLKRVAHVAKLFQTGDRSERSNIHREDEIGLLASTFDSMADEVQTLIQHLEEHAAHLEHQKFELAKTLEELQLSIADRTHLSEMVQEMSTPVIRIHDQVVLLPLIGSIDTVRAHQIQTTMLKGIEKFRARKAIIDLTGVPIVDTQVASTLVDTTHASQLLGVEVIIVGISPDVAQSMVHLGIDLSRIVTLADLQSGILYALRKLGFAMHTNGRRHNVHQDMITHAQLTHEHVL